MVTPTLKMKANTGDITLDCHDSCNWCCWWPCRKKLEEGDIIYIKKDGTLEKFDFKKAQSVLDSNRVTIMRLEARIDEIASEKKICAAHAKAQISREVGGVLDKLVPSPITLRQLKQIDSVFGKVVKRESPKCPE